MNKEMQSAIQVKQILFLCTKQVQSDLTGCFIS
jgi:hypothetical protein